MSSGSQTRWKRIETLFHQALDLDAGEREAFLSHACASDWELRDELKSLLASFDMTFSPVAASVSEEADQLLQAQPEELSRLGAWRLIKTLGQGGMGTVYLGVRDDDQYTQTVAVKVLRAGLAHHPELQLLFRNERQILADFDHPNIARLLDGGITPAGSPYLVMEYVDGTALDAYCQGARLGLNARLELFRTLCGAVAYAHRHLVIHRDIKPTNVLVTSDGKLKLLDFGIAKLIDPLQSPDMGQSGGTEVALTPDYASPEQLLGRPISTATDIYALGILLFELLTGEVPFSGARRALRTGRNDSASQDLPPASAVCLGNCHLARAQARKLRGDLDRIVAKCLRRDPAERYASASQLADDLDRYFQGQPIEAGPKTFSYRAGKFVRRHRAAVFLSLLALILLICGAAAMGVLARRATVGEAEARREEQFLASIFRAATPEGSKGKQVTARELLDQAAGRLRSELGSDPVLEEEATQNIGNSYVSLGLYERAQPLLERAVQLAEQSRGQRNVVYADALANLGTDYRLQGEFSRAEPIFRRVVAIEESISGRSSQPYGHALSNLGECLYLEDKDNEAEQTLRQSLELERPLPASLQDGTRSYLALTIERRGAFPEAAQLLREFAQIKGATEGKESNDYLVAMHNLAGVQIDMGDLEGAIRSDREVLATRERIWGKRHPDTLYPLNNLGWIYLELGRWREAEPILRQNVDVAGDDPTTMLYISARANWGRLLDQKGDFTGAASQYDQVMSILAQKHQARGWIAAKIESYQALLALDCGQSAQAVRMAGESVNQDKALGGDSSPQLASGLLTLGLAQLIHGDPGDAEESFGQAVAIRQKLYPPGHTELLLAQVRLAEAQLAAGRVKEASELVQTALNAARSSQFPLPAWRMGELEWIRGLTLCAQGQDREAATMLQTSLPKLRDYPQAAVRRYLIQLAQTRR